MKNNVLNTNLEGKVAVVTGAGGVLCSNFSKVLARAGAKVALLDLNLEAAQKWATEIAAEGGIARAYRCNVLEKESCLEVAEQVRKDLGTCDVLLNGAGGNNPRATTDKEYYEPGDLDADTKARLAQGARIVEVLKQNRNHPIAVEDQVCIFYAVTHDFLKDVQVQDVAEYEDGLYARMAAQHNDVLDAIRTTGQLSAETEAALKAALTDYTRDFLKTKA